MTLAAENFLLPNGTFFVVLLIFVIMLLVIRAFVVPSIQKVLTERDEMIHRTVEDNRTANAEFTAAQDEYNALIKEARGEATASRDEARAQGRDEMNARKQRATDEAAVALAATSRELTAEGEKAGATASNDVDALARVLAGRVLGIDPAAVSGDTSTTSGTVS